MKRTNYLDTTLVNEQIKPYNILNNKSIIVNYIPLNGTIYRSDKHTMTMLREKPTFFSDYQSTMSYMGKAYIYIKKYDTKEQLKLLSLNDDSENIDRISNFFTEYLPSVAKSESAKHDIIITYILLQLAYGLIKDNTKNINMCGVENSFIETYLKNNYKLEDNDWQDLNIILTDYMNRDLIPSRCSLRYIDKILMKCLNKIIPVYGFSGIWYDASNKTYTERMLCKIVNTELYNKDTNKLTCVPSEICIFNPKKYLSYVELSEYNNDKLTIIPISFDNNRNIKSMQHKLAEAQKQNNKYKYKYYKYKLKLNEIRK
jgi:hypothetical protein